MFGSCTWWDSGACTAKAGTRWLLGFDSCIKKVMIAGYAEIGMALIVEIQPSIKGKRGSFYRMTPVNIDKTTPGYLAYNFDNEDASFDKGRL